MSLGTQLSICEKRGHHFKGAPHFSQTVNLWLCKILQLYMVDEATLISHFDYENWPKATQFLNIPHHSSFHPYGKVHPTHFCMVVIVYSDDLISLKKSYPRSFIKLSVHSEQIRQIENEVFLEQFGPIKVNLNLGQYISYFWLSLICFYVCVCTF